jgi:hypothetical protein
VNIDDDNHNGTNDVNEPLSGPYSVVSGENDLAPIWLATPGFTNGTIVTFSVSKASWSYPGCGGIRVWKSAQRGPDGPVLDNVSSSNLILSTNHLSEAFPMTLYVEGVSASRTNDDVVFYVQALGSCINSAKVTVVDIASTVWEAGDSPLTNNAALGGPGGGLAIFSDKPTPTSSGNYQAVRVKTTITPRLAGVHLHLTSFDVDDPSANAAPVDDESQTKDNRGIPQDGQFPGSGGNSITLTTDGDGMAQTEFDVTMQPGDNFRVVASPLADFAAAYHTQQNTNNGALVTAATSLIGIDSRYTTPMLTVWRRLHVEVDSMAAVANNLVTRNITAISGSGIVATRLTLDQNLTTSLSPVDNSANLSGSGNGRFENGWIKVGADQVQTTGIDGNGDAFVQRTDGFNIPAEIAAGGATNSVGQVLSMAGSVFTISVSLGTNLYIGGSFRVAGTSFTISTNTASTVTVSASSPTIPIFLHDDDVDGVIPGVIVTGMQQIWQPAYVLPMFDTGQDNSDAPFHLNTPLAEFEAHLSESRGSPSSSVDYWVVLVKNGYQPDAGTDDNDPNSEGTYRAAALPSAEGVLMFEESIRDWISAPNVAPGYGANGADPDPSGDAGRQGRRQEILNHEVGHLFGLDHADGLPAASGRANGDVMLPTCCPPSVQGQTRQSSTLGLTSLHKIRAKPEPGP